MGCIPEQELQIWTPAIIHHPSQRRFLTSCAYKIRKYKGRKAFFAYMSMKRHLEGIKKRFNGNKKNIKTRVQHTGTDNQCDSMIQNF